VCCGTSLPPAMDFVHVSLFPLMCCGTSLPPAMDFALHPCTPQSLFFLMCRQALWWLYSPILSASASLSASVTVPLSLSFCHWHTDKHTEARSFSGSQELIPSLVSQSVFAGTHRSKELQWQAGAPPCPDSWVLAQIAGCNFIIKGMVCLQNFISFSSDFNLEEFSSPKG